MNTQVPAWTSGTMANSHPASQHESERKPDTLAPYSAMSARVNPYRETRCAAALRVAVHCARRERRDAHRHVLRALGSRRAVAHPGTARRDDRLPGMDFEHTAVMLDAQHAAKHDRVLVEFRRLPRLDPPGRAP